MRDVRKDVALVECAFRDRGACWTASADLLTRNFQAASEPVASNGEIYRATKLERNKLANYARSIAGSAWGYCGGPPVSFQSMAR
jgi:hypothetical protein